ncbi:MAG: trigger factor, partial [bacterium]|nr:trigger factor [bacterium]
MKAKLTKLPKSLVELEGEIPEQEFAAYRPRAVAHLSEKVKIDGFREGKAPEAVLVQKVGEMAVLEEMAELALEEAYPKLVMEHTLDVIGPPEISIVKLGIGSPLGFKIKSAVVPELALPRYAAIAKETLSKKEDAEATDKEVDEALEELRKQRAIKKEGEEKPLLPDLDDTFARSLGQFESLVALKAKLKENIGLEKAARAKEKKRVEMIGKIAAETAGEIPDLLVESESEKMLLRLKGD